jgi:hypothetical protein
MLPRDPKDLLVPLVHLGLRGLPEQAEVNKDLPDPLAHPDLEDHKGPLDQQVVIFALELHPDTIQVFW